MFTENAGVKFTGAKQLQTAGADDAGKAFQDGGKGSAYRASLEDLGMVVFYCQFGAIRSPCAMASYQKYLASRGKTQRVLLLEGGVTAFAKDYPGYKSKPDFCLQH
jgi:hypothetical protein